MPHIRIRAFVAGTGLTACLLVSSLAAQSGKPAVAAHPAPSGLHTGIRVHGHWTIVVRNPDGTVAAKREFENSLQLDGANALPLLLSGIASPGSWAVVVGASSGVGPCPNGDGFDWWGTSGAPTAALDACVSAQAGRAYGPLQACNDFEVGACAPTLAVSVVKTGTTSTQFGVTFPTYGLELTGVVNVGQAGTIGTVGTLFEACNSSSSGGGLTSGDPTALAASTVSPATCQIANGSDVYVGDTVFSSFLWYMTATGVPGGPISVVGYQTVQVTVVISFS